MLSKHKSAMFCSCRDCQNEKEYPNSRHVHAHLIIRGFVEKYTCWIKHGEEGGNDIGHLDQDAIHTNQDLSDEDVIEIGTKYSHVAEDVEEMIRDAKGNDDYTDDEFANLKELMKDMKIPLYSGCKEIYTKLFMALKLMQLKATHHWTDRSFKALLDLLRDMLPEGNEIPKTTYEAKMIICPMGLKVIMGKTNLEQPEDLEVSTDPLDESVLANIREELATFLVTQVINKRGEFHCANPTSVV